MKRCPLISGTNRLKDYAIAELLRLLRCCCGTLQYTAMPYRRLALHIGLPHVMPTTDHMPADNADTIAALRAALDTLERRGCITVKPAKHDAVLVRLCPMPVTKAGAAHV